MNASALMPLLATIHFPFRTSQLMILLTYASISSAECMCLRHQTHMQKFKKYPAAIRQPRLIFDAINILSLLAVSTSNYALLFCPSFLRLCFVESQARTTLQQSFAHRYRGSNAICRTKAVNFQSYTSNWVNTPCVVVSLTDKLWNQVREKKSTISAYSQNYR